MKTKTLLMILILMVSAGIAIGAEKPETIALKNPVDFSRVLVKNNVFLKRCFSFDIADGYFYFLEKNFGTVFKVDEKTGKLAKTIGTKGQGPFEIQDGRRIRVRNGKIYILDRGFNGFKIFDTDGKRLNEIKLTFSMGFSDFDVNDKDEIFLARLDTNSGNYVIVLNLEGEKVRSIIPLEDEEKATRLSENWYYRIRLDKQGNIYLLFTQNRKLSKYDGKGELLWTNSIKNEILDAQKNEDEVRGGANGAIYRTASIYSIEVTPNDNVLIGHIGGGCLYSPFGKLMSTITAEITLEDANYTGPSNFHEVRVSEERLINSLVFGQVIRIYKFKEKKK